MFGVIINNVGNKIVYLEFFCCDFFLINLKIGFFYIVELDDYNKIMYFFEFQKLLVFILLRYVVDVQGNIYIVVGCFNDVGVIVGMV